MLLISGRLAKLSADRMIDANTDTPYYRAEIELVTEDLAHWTMSLARYACRSFNKDWRTNNAGLNVPAETIFEVREKTE